MLVKEDVVGLVVVCVLVVVFSVLLVCLECLMDVVWFGMLMVCLE